MCVDTMGRCINGLDQHPELRKHVRQLLKSTPNFMKGIASAGTMMRKLVTTFGKRQCMGGRGMDTRYIDLENTHRRLGTFLLSLWPVFSASCYFAKLYIFCSVLAWFFSPVALLRSNLE